MLAQPTRRRLFAVLASRELARIQPGGPGNTLTWGVQLYNGSIYASDMLSGFWQVSVPQ